MNRRYFIIGGLAGAASAHALWASKAFSAPQESGMAGMDMNDAAQNSAGRILTLPIGAPLPKMQTLKNLSSTPGAFEATIEASPTEVEFAKNVQTHVLAYNKLVPGPLIDVTEGDKVRITFQNTIPEQDSTIHWHGLPVPPDQDGSPADAVASGKERVYEFTVPEGSAGSYWYHPHPHGRTAEQVYRGLAGAFIVRPKSDPLPASLGDTVLFISSLSLNSDGSIPKNTPADQINGREGDHVLVNGAKEPVLDIVPGSSRRFRLYNASSARFLRLSVQKHTMTLVGTDGGLLGSPQGGLDELLLAPAERAEVVIDFQQQSGRIAMISQPYERGWMGRGKPEAKTLTLMTFNLTGTPGQPTVLPPTLREIAALPEPSGAQLVEIGEKMGMANGAMTMDFLLDGKSYAMGRRQTGKGRQRRTLGNRQQGRHGPSFPYSRRAISDGRARDGWQSHACALPCVERFSEHQGGRNCPS